MAQSVTLLLRSKWSLLGVKRTSSGASKTTLMTIADIRSTELVLCKTMVHKREGGSSAGSGSIMPFPLGVPLIS